MTIRVRGRSDTTPSSSHPAALTSAPHWLSWVFLLVWLFWSVGSAAAAEPFMTPDECVFGGDVSGEGLRVIDPFDAAAYLTSTSPILYDFHEVTRPIDQADLIHESELSVAVRLLLGEVGVWRLLDNRFGLEEAIGILQTVDNRRTPALYNPAGVSGIRAYPGCGPDASFASCAEPSEYLGLQYKRALAPLDVPGERTHLVAAIDLAVQAWFAVRTGAAPDVTGGATQYVHRCGGTAYGRPTPYCDGNRSTPDIRGAVAVTGPVVFKAPNEFLERRGYYTVAESARVDFAVETSVATRPPA